MGHGQDLPARLHDEEAHLKCFQTTFREDAKSRIKRVSSEAERSWGSHKGIELKRCRDGYVNQCERGRLRRFVLDT